MSVNQQRFEEIIQDISQDCACRDGYCFFRHIIESKHLDVRMLMQIKLIEKFKWIWSKEADKDIGWQKACEKWVEEDLARLFAVVYNEDDCAKVLCEKLIALKSLPS